MDHAIVLYDGVCGLCNRLVQFVLKRDVNDRFHFASLQSEFASSLLRKYEFDPKDLDTVYVVVNHCGPTERPLARSDAILYILQQLGGVWKIALIGKLLPKFFRDALYNLVARNRYRVFGRRESCMLPPEKHRHKFLDVIAY